MENLDLSNVQSIVESLKIGIKEYRNSDKYKKMLDTMSKFYKYSLDNQILIYLQNPEASYCGSMKFWNSLGRYVSKGEKGIKIFCPVPTEYEIVKKDTNGNPLLDESGNEIKQKVKQLNFKVGNTFDISQTYGKEIYLECEELIGEGLDVCKLAQDMKEIAQVNDVKIQPISGQAKGYFDTENREIVVREGMSDLQTTKSLIHESAHALVFLNEDLVKTLDRQDHEIVAESVAYVVCKRFGLDTSEYSFNYVNSWASNDDKRIEKCMDYISTTSKKLIEKMEDKMGLKKEIDVKKEKYNANAPKKVIVKNHKSKKKQKEIK